jgi:gamma-glutamyltranspeptidase/glutathione hydrolase
MGANPDLDRFDSRRSTAYARNGMVATSQPLAAQAGVAALRDGGNAFDAAVTTAAALNVVEPMSTGIGGDAFALYRTADGDVGAFRSCGGAPSDATLDAVRRRVAERSGVDPADASMPGAGPLSVTVPGTVRGWERLLADHGRRSLAAALDPAIAEPACDQGDASIRHGWCSVSAEGPAIAVVPGMLAHARGPAAPHAKP